MVAIHSRRPAPHAPEGEPDPIVATEGVMGGRPVIRGTRITVASVKGRLSGGDSVQDLLLDYPDVPRAAFEAAALYETEPDDAAARPPRKGG